MRKKSPPLYSSKTNWKIFQSVMDLEIKQSFKSVLDQADLDIEISYSSFVSIIERALEQANPRVRGDRAEESPRKSIRPSCIWWTEEYNKLI